MTGWRMPVPFWLPVPDWDGCRGTPGEGVAYRQDKSREVRYGWGVVLWRISADFWPPLRGVRNFEVCASRFWRFPAVSRTSRFFP
jgi:hypothetical protein